MGCVVIVGFGMDMVDVARIARSYARFGRRFAVRILTEAELARFDQRDPVSTLAKYFCAKEAAGKALGTGVFGPVGFQQIVIEHRRSGKPELRFLGAAAERFARIGGVRAHVTITDERNLAAAVVVLEDGR
jgi:holo-[acyl-carrier protein] synthase